MGPSFPRFARDRRRAGRLLLFRKLRPLFDQELELRSSIRLLLRQPVRLDGPENQRLFPETGLESLDPSLVRGDLLLEHRDPPPPPRRFPLFGRGSDASLPGTLGS